ncbi:hypothetical protein PR202_ga30141 [Eleusine coracana subsp. coracana]|uniref:Uncharacterized protein n=1 Tax=Eleusine coracana subsp. coracana TaxID=191504 RepID=A0AAV5DPT1_ELECO|nr:hypothetical protein PR202_ga30141 [Eleusine coracana subsp. coracana]
MGFYLLPGKTHAKMNTIRFSLWDLESQEQDGHGEKLPAQANGRDAERSCIAFLQKWKLLLKQPQKEDVDKLTKKVINWCAAFRPIKTLACDIGEM